MLRRRGRDNRHDSAYLFVLSVRLEGSARRYYACPPTPKEIGAQVVPGAHAILVCGDPRRLSAHRCCSRPLAELREGGSNTKSRNAALSSSFLRSQTLSANNCFATARAGGDAKRVGPTEQKQRPRNPIGSGRTIRSSATLERIRRRQPQEPPPASGSSSRGRGQRAATSASVSCAARTTASALMSNFL
jgi:hypothetical protein